MVNKSVLLFECQTYYHTRTLEFRNGQLFSASLICTTSFKVNTARHAQRPPTYKILGLRTTLNLINLDFLYWFVYRTFAETHRKTLTSMRQLLLAYWRHLPRQCCWASYQINSNDINNSCALLKHISELNIFISKFAYTTTRIEI